MCKNDGYVVFYAINKDIEGEGLIHELNKLRQLPRIKAKGRYFLETLYGYCR